MSFEWNCPLATTFVSHQVATNFLIEVKPKRDRNLLPETLWQPSVKCYILLLPTIILLYYISLKKTRSSSSRVMRSKKQKKNTRRYKKCGRIFFCCRLSSSLSTMTKETPTTRNNNNNKKITWRILFRNDLRAPPSLDRCLSPYTLFCFGWKYFPMYKQGVCKGVYMVLLCTHTVLVLFFYILYFYMLVVFCYIAT